MNFNISDVPSPQEPEIRFFQAKSEEAFDDCGPCVSTTTEA